MPTRSAAVLALCSAGLAQAPNYDESKIPSFELPDPLVRADGTRVTDAAQWPARRAELLALFEQHVYGRMPPAPPGLRFEVVEQDRDALGGSATRRQIAITFGTPDAPQRIDLLIYVPNERDGMVPAFLGMNFYGNHTVHPDPAILLPRSWVPNDPGFGGVDFRATDAGRGVRASRWPIERVIARGYAFATVYYGDLDPDYDDGFHNGVHPAMDGGVRDAASWGAIGAWAWGLSRALDALEREAGVDGTKVAVLGHSRLGKTALWAGACDPRFALVISNDSGCGGAALSRRRFGETVEAITRRFPHWFCARFRDYAGREDALPVDQHELVALCAPRPVYVASASEDDWADPSGELLAARAAAPVYGLFGLAGIGAAYVEWPGTACGDGAIGRHLRQGKHDLTAWDWERFLDFADRHLRR